MHALNRSKFSRFNVEAACSPQNPPTQRRIRADDVRLALRARTSLLFATQGPLCAMSDGGFSTNSRFGSIACKPYNPEIDTRRAVPPLLMPLRLKQLPAHVVERVRTAGGPAEVKRTWGIGYKALLADLNRKAKG